jgi:hypothetical protein
MEVNEMYKKPGILAIAVTLLLLGTGISAVLAKMPDNASSNPDVLKIELNASGNVALVMVYHDLKAGYWDIYFGGMSRHNITSGNISFNDGQVNRFIVP